VSKVTFDMSHMSVLRFANVRPLVYNRGITENEKPTKLGRNKEMVDFDRFDWDAIFTAVDNAQTLNDNAYTFAKGLIIEMALAKHSDGQLHWEGGSEKGYDLVDNDGKRYEVKSLADGWESKTAKAITIANHRSDQKQSREQEYDHLIFVAGDTQKKSIYSNNWIVAVADYEDTLPYITNASADMKIKKMPSYLFDKVANAPMQDSKTDIRSQIETLMMEVV